MPICPLCKETKEESAFLSHLGNRVVGRCRACRDKVKVIKQSKELGDVTPAPPLALSKTEMEGLRALLVRLAATAERA